MCLLPRCRLDSGRSNLDRATARERKGIADCLVGEECTPRSTNGIVLVAPRGVNIQPIEYRPPDYGVFETHSTPCFKVKDSYQPVRERLSIAA
jgi:hypothetical protein